MIGIRIASGEFYPILGEGASSAKKLVLTTVKDDQPSVHIELYRSEEIGFRDAVYVGNLVIDDIAPRPKQLPDIELVLRLERGGSLSAVATDMESGRAKTLNVLLREGEPLPDRFQIPDFELTPASPFAAEENDFSARVPPPPEEPEAKLTQMRRTAAKPLPEPKPRLGLPAIIAICAAALLVLLILAYIIFRLATGGSILPFGAAKAPAATVAAAIPSPVAPSPEPSIVPSPSPPAPSPAPSPKATAAPAKNGSKGVNHKIRWGDTLWHISIRYYGTPWLYKSIAKANGIKNPDRIISGRTLWIPPR